MKIGGSLLDLPDLGGRLNPFRSLWGARPLLVVGGGPAADLVREWDQRYQLGEERAHWLALDSLELTSRFLAAAWSNACVTTLSEIEAAWERKLLPSIRPREWFETAEQAGIPTPPHTWETTTDTIAAWVAAMTGAESLWLLKSVACPGSLDEASQRGLVDSQFVHWIPAGRPIQWVNLRDPSEAITPCRLNTGQSPIRP